jgi:hypothetical protein
MLRFVEYISHWYWHIYNIRKVLILLFTDVKSSEILASENCSPAGIERDWTYKVR